MINMKRRHIFLPLKLDKEIEKKAKKLGIPVSEWIRQVLQKASS